ncbi:AAA domain-containing protein [Roseimicrobium sp. ORNL1]|uniref:AAA domain-containing protein n=1 Tax=Roseimicrobium sp. ORNL1 TaxID=2711231 RepID=UPI0013E1AFEB|nr:AAA domain-containing protein [Roseimicrobium sp. ORNL1]QIF06151.1 WGR domain-containing protein [Roseimicrobium sp. ORNL1]
MEQAGKPFLSWLRAVTEHGGMETDDVLSVVLPLIRQVQAVHDTVQVAGLSAGALSYDAHHNQLRFDPSLASDPKQATSKVEALQAPMSRALDVTGHGTLETNLDEASTVYTNDSVAVEDKPLTRPVYVPDYGCWEQRVGHHDVLTDVFLLGQVLASVACGLDFTDAEDVRLFANHRHNLFNLHPRLHPVVAAVIEEMTELNRHRRACDLASIIKRLETYREQPDDFDVRRIAGLEQATPSGRRKLIQARLRDRLFEISRRNRLIYYKPTQQSLNLTVASVPTLLDYRNVKPEQLCYAHSEIESMVSQGKVMPLGKYLRFEEQPYLQGVLDKIISEARRDRAEYGFAQLRLVLVFLRWHNLKESPNEVIESPLLLLPVELTKKKGVRDSYTLDPIDTGIAEVNPALRFHLKEVYNLDLPEEVDLQKTSLRQFHEQLRAQIQASEPGVILKCIEKPQVKLVQERARMRVDQFRRRQMLKTGKPVARKVSYSYKKEDYRPLGLQLFLEKVKPQPMPLRVAAGGTMGRESLPLDYLVDPQGETPSQGVMETSQETYSLQKGSGSSNPYSWEYDLCSLTLANFNYRKMSLVHDYEHLLEHDPACEAFDTIFSIAPREQDISPAVIPLKEQHFVVACDAAQAAAVAKARNGRSFIIQGPPGTGKSQTITNLIADNIARGKRVLFVCEKRAAIDVVFHRLRQQGLDELCCLIHDSQTDKKAFIQNLKQTYEGFLQQAQQDGDVTQARQETVKRLEQEMESIKRFGEVMISAKPGMGASAHQMLQRLVELRPEVSKADALLNPEELDASTDELLPDYGQWKEHGEVARRLRQALVDLGEDEVLAEHPLRHVSQTVLESERPLHTLRESLNAVEDLLDSLESSLSLAGDAESVKALPLGHFASSVDFAHEARPLAERGLMTALDGSGDGKTKAFASLQKDLQTKIEAHRDAAVKSEGWHDPLPPDDVQEAITQAKATENSVFRFLNPTWWRLRKVVQSRYDFSKHKVPPAFSRVLGTLAKTQEAEAAVAQVKQRAATEWNIDDLPAFVEQMTALKQRLDAAPPVLRGVLRKLCASDEGLELAKALAEAHGDTHELQKVLNTALNDASAPKFAELPDVIAALRESADLLPELASILRELGETPAAFANMVRRVPLPVDALEFAMARKGLRSCWRDDRHAARFDGPQLAERIGRFHRGHSALLDQNAASIRHGVKRAFLEQVQVSSLPAAQLTPEQKIFKKTFSSGRRDLEHEFGKTMRYRSIRDLATDTTGQVIRGLKPVWLMSPLSVSDTLPLDPGLFDVVIFDEASQVPLEEAIPSLYRAKQVIVVGDEMQLPPTSFFASSRGGDEEEITVEEEGEKIAISLDADSFLTQSAASLPSTLLAWHYRSRYEALISFSNASFYSGNLLTIPDRRPVAEGLGDIVVKSAADAEANAAKLLARSISFHRMERGLYENRRNLDEANYIANLVRTLLLQGTKLSLGIVAFSEAQQTAIEDALERLAGEDADFATRLEAEYNREEEDQFVGLFVKNLENVQGDERDIILLSICYGYDANHRMLMNFGPINQKGGEKRLNVIFSRAKHHMAVVSSIRHVDITNDWNDGASALKNFLNYAEHTSRGELRHARQVLEGANPLNRQSLRASSSQDVVATQLAEALRARGHQVDVQVGQSRFRCDLAVRDAIEGHYTLAIQIDTPEHYANTDVQERSFTRPGLLKAFGWSVLHVLTKDWFEDAPQVLARIERALGGEVEAVELEEEAPVEVASAELLQSAQTSIEPSSMPAESVAEGAAATSHEAHEPAQTATAASQGQNGSVSPVRRFELVSGASSKFWEVSVDGATLIVRFGRIGTNGQEQRKAFPDEATAQRQEAKLILEKTSKGYVEVK